MLRDVLLACVMWICACTVQRFDDDDRHAIEATLAAQRDAWNRGDLETFMQAYTREHLVFTSGGNIRRGWDETLARYRERYAEGGNMGRLAFTDLEIRSVAPDAAVVLGRWEVSESQEAGRGVFTLVMVREGDAWRIVHDHTSAAAP
jgi:uncharacterized protein (TIGR02246 family)